MIPRPAKIAIRSFEWRVSRGDPEIHIRYDFADVNNKHILQLQTDGGFELTIPVDAASIQNGGAGYKNLAQAIMKVSDCIEEIAHFKDPEVPKDKDGA